MPRWMRQGRCSPLIDCRLSIYMVAHLVWRRNVFRGRTMISFCVFS
jgi:hypothetical protein